jgi:cobalt/nickel transport system permease protein
MHISEGVLDARICIGGYAVAAGLTALALRKIRREDIPKISVMGAFFFVSSLIHFKVGISSVHLTLVGLLGIVLGFPSVLALLVGLFFQAVMFQHGGLSTLGVNTTVFAVGALLVYGGFSLFVRKVGKRSILISLVGGILSALGVLVAALMVILIIRLSGEELVEMSFVFSVSHSVLAVVEGVITFFLVQQILRIKPEILGQLHQGIT